MVKTLLRSSAFRNGNTALYF